MGGFRSARLRSRRAGSILATVGLVAGMLVVTASASARDGANTTCRVTNTTLGITYNGTTGSGLQAALDAAGSGDTVRVAGSCVGSFTISNTTLKLAGVHKASHPLKGSHDPVSGSRRGGPQVS
jgi:hypothetical protein